MNSELTEILIGKFLDSEITPAEQRLLDAELQRNPQAQQMLNSLASLRDQTQEVLDQQLQASKATPAEIFDRAWQQSKPKRRAMTSIGRYGRWAAAIVIGFLLGNTYHQQQMRLHAPATTPSIIATKPAANITKQTISANATNRPAIIDTTIEKPQRDPSPEPTAVEWYTYSDNQGNQWLIENPRSMVASVAYNGSL